MKNVLITGTSRGIGKALAESFLIKGFQVIGTSTTGEIAINHRNLKKVKLDLSQPTSIIENIKELNNIKIDLLINNAGVLLEDWNNPKINIEQLRKTFEINVFGLIDFCEQLISNINPQGTIVNLGSTWGSFSEQTDQFQPHYKISKAAIHMYTKVLSVRLKSKKIKVICIDPGWTKTDMGTENAKLSPKEAASFIMKTILTSNTKTGTFWKEGELREW